jgi:hypothetical protein
MPETIRDGKGRGYLAAVNADNQIITRSTIVEQRLMSAIDLNYFEVTTGQITLTDTTETGIIYLKNDVSSNMNIVIDRVFYDIWTSTSGSGADGILKYYKNPTITGGTDIVPVSTNFGSVTTATGTFKKSLTTMTGAVWWTAYITDKMTIALEEGRIVIPSGTSFGITVVAPTGNTSIKVSINVAFYYLDLTLVQ